MIRLILRLVIAATLVYVLAMAIEYHQAPGLIGYAVGLISGASILAFFEVTEGKTK